MLEFGLINWAMDKLRNKGFTPVITPDISRNSIVDGCGFLPRDFNASKNHNNIILLAQIYHLKENNLSLIGTSEITIAGLMANEIGNKKDLPQKYASFSHCFRHEAGRGHESR